MLLVLSVLALFAGPALYHWMRQGGLIARAFDRSIVAALVLLLVFLLVPEAFSGLGWLALALIFFGYLLPGLLEAAVKGAARTFHLISLVLALAGLALHAMLDGAGLAGSEALALAIILHRLGVGLVLWLIVQPAFGRRVALAVLVLVSAATLLGYGLSEQMISLSGANAVLVIQSLIIGTIIHSLVHRGHMRRENG